MTQFWVLPLSIQSQNILGQFILRHVPLFIQAFSFFYLCSLLNIKQDQNQSIIIYQTKRQIPSITLVIFHHPNLKNRPSFTHADVLQFQVVKITINNKMNEGNTIIYHKHIQSNITKLQQRKDKFIGHRLDFLKKYCEPIQNRIVEIQKQIQKYKIMRDTQDEVIQNEPDIKKIKEEIRNYIQTHNYYQERVNQLENKSIEIEQLNQGLYEKIHILKYGIKNHKEELGFHLPTIMKNRSQTYYNHATENHAKSFILPSVHGQNEEQKDEIRSNASKINKKIVSISQKIQKFHANQSSIEIKLEQTIAQEQSSEEKSQKDLLKKKVLQLRQKITKFNKTQGLFHDCFETKKCSVQKSVSQLQSKLITNRAQFLNICQAICSKQTNISFDQFKRLSCDEIITLFISFVWLNRKLNYEFVEKRKLVMELAMKLPKIQNF